MLKIFLQKHSFDAAPYLNYKLQKFVFQISGMWVYLVLGIFLHIDCTLCTYICLLLE